MTEFKNVETELVPREVIKERWFECDRCLERIPPCDYGEMFDSSLCIRIGNSYPECGSWEEVNMHFCKECSLKLVSDLCKLNYRVVWKDKGY
jgi:hypothetical protein